jgi:hypothetical protein
VEVFLGTLEAGGDSSGNGIDDWGQIAGSSSGFAALYSNGRWQDLNNLIPKGSGWLLSSAGPINDAGQIAGIGFSPDGEQLGFLLNPIYKASVQPPINADGSSAFSAQRGAVVPVNFNLTAYSAPTCKLLPATLAITRTTGTTLAPVYKSTFSRTGCQYHHNVGAFKLGVGTYRVDISINGIFVGHAVFALK